MAPTTYLDLPREIRDEITIDVMQSVSMHLRYLIPPKDPKVRKRVHGLNKHFVVRSSKVAMPAFPTEKGGQRLDREFWRLWGGSQVSGYLDKFVVQKLSQLCRDQGIHLSLYYDFFSSPLQSDWEGEPSIPFTRGDGSAWSFRGVPIWKEGVEMPAIHVETVYEIKGLPPIGPCTGGD